MEPNPLCSGAVFGVLGRRKDENTEYLLAKVDSEVSKITGDVRMNGMQRYVRRLLELCVAWASPHSMMTSPSTTT